MTRLHAVRCPPHHAAEVFAAVWAAGDALLPLAFDAPRRAIDEVLRTCRPAVVTEIDAEGQAVTRARGDALPVEDDIALVVATSGSTGAPKGVELSHDALDAAVERSLRRLGCRPGDRWLLALPTHHVAGVGVLLRARALGSDVEVAADASALADAARAGDAAGRPGARFVSLVPTQLARLLDEGVEVRGLGTVLLGGGPARDGLVDEARGAGLRVVTSYGMSETCGGCVYDGVPLDDVEVALASEPAATGRADRDMAGTGGSGRDAAGTGGRVGRIRVRGPVLFRRYRGDTDAHPTARDGAGWFTTGDVGRWVSRAGIADRLEVLGRADDVAVSGGENVPLALVRATLLTHPAVADAAVVARADPTWGQVVLAAVVREATAGTVGVDELREHVRSTLPAAFVPREVVVVDALPRDAMGKVTAASVADAIARRRSPS